MKRLEDEGTLVDRMDVLMHEDIVPWLFEKMQDFLHMDFAIEEQVNSVFEEAFAIPQVQHRDQITQNASSKQEQDEEVIRAKREKAELKQKAKEEAEKKKAADEL